MPIIQNTLQNQQGFCPYLSSLLWKNYAKLNTNKTRNTLVKWISQSFLFSLLGEGDLRDRLEMVRTILAKINSWQG